MALFGKKKKSIQPKEKPIERETPEEKPRAIQRASLTSGRMASLYQRLYQWIFSVNITADVYQIESGEDTFTSEALPIRGYYHELLGKLEQEMISEQREAFSSLFCPESIRRAMEEGKTSLSGSFCANELGREPGEEKSLKWYEFRAEWLEDVDLRNMICVLSVRHISGDLDNGRQVSVPTALSCAEDGTVDWDATRIKRLDCAKNGMDFEYSVEDDCMYLHRIRGSREGDQETKNFVATLATRADLMLSHESVRQMTHILRAEPGRGVEQTEVLYRKGGVFGAPFRHYRVVAAPVEEEGKPSWIIGRLEDIEEEAVQREHSAEIANELGNLLKIVNISMYQINTTQGLIFRIVQDENGFHREEKPQRLADYLQKRIATGRIAPEAQKEYLKWLENGYLQRKTAQGLFEFEAEVKEIGDVDYRWYMETIIPIKGKPGQFVRWRRDDTEGHQARETAYQNKELGHIAEYNGQMLDTIASLIEFRNVESSSHIANVRALTRILLEDIQKRSPQYEITKRQIDMYVQASTMHDIGKITIPDYILNKQGKLTPEEFAIMKRHTTDGAAIVERLNMPGQEELKSCVRDVALHHHERFDGKGYPDNLCGDQVAIGVQVISLADVYDALVSTRCYKRGYVSDEALRMIRDGQCGTFNPCLIESLKACEQMMREVYAEGNND